MQFLIEPFKKASKVILSRSPKSPIEKPTNESPSDCRQINLRCRDSLKHRKNYENLAKLKLHALTRIHFG